MNCSSGGTEQSATMSNMSSAAQPAQPKPTVKPSMAELRAAQTPTTDDHKVVAIWQVLKCLEGQGWLVPPFVNGCRATELNKQCNRELKDFGSQLQWFDADNCSFDQWPYVGHLATTLQWVATHCPQLEHLILPDRAFFNSPDLTEVIQAIAQGCSQLKTLDLAGHTFSDVAIEAVARACPQLERLEIGESSIRECILITVAEHCRNLTHLGLNSCGEGITDKAILAVATNCLNLQFLNIGGCNCTAKALAQGFPELTHLILCECMTLLRKDPDCAYEAWEAAMHRCPKLVDPNVYSILRCCTACMTSVILNPPH